MKSNCMKIAGMIALALSLTTSALATEHQQTNKPIAYISSPWDKPNFARKLMQHMETLGFQSSKDWTKNQGVAASIKNKSQDVLANFKAIDNSDYYIAYFSNGVKDWGTHSLLTYALAKHKKVLAVIPPHSYASKSHILYHPDVKRFASLKALDSYVKHTKV